MQQTSVQTKRIIFVAAFAAFLATFNETFLNIGFTPIMKDLSVSISTVQWLATAYMLGAAVMVPVSAFAYRSIPTRRLFLGSVALLVIGSAVGALAACFPVLLAGRIIQAFGTGILIPVGMNITLETAPREKLGVYMGIMGAMTTLGPSLSVILAGVLLSFFSWHALLWTFAAMSLALFLCGACFLTDVAELTHPKLDAPSVAFIGLALLGVLYGVSTVFGGSLPVACASVIPGVLFLVIFIRRQYRLKEPLINLSPLSSKAFSAGVVVNMISLIVIFAMNIVLPIFIQTALGASSFAASLALFPAILLSCAVAPAAGRLYDRHGPGTLLPLGFALICIFALALAFVRNFAGVPLLAVLYIPVICGSALIIGPVQSFALSKLKPEENPHGVTVMSTGFQIAGCIGASLFTGVYFSVMSTKAATSGISPRLASTDAFAMAALLAAVFAFAGLLLAFRIRGFARTAVPAQTSPATLRSLMKTDIYSVQPDMTLLDALKYITEHRVSGVPVVDASKNLIGFISDGDIIRYLSNAHVLFESAYAAAALRSEGQRFENKLGDLIHLTVGGLAHPQVITVDVNDGLGEVCRVLGEHRLKKVPVLENGKMVGIVNSSNITKYVLRVCLPVNA